MDDRTVGLVLRALRRKRGWRQSDLAARAGCSQITVSRIERGHIDGASLRLVRRLFQALEARLQLAPTWRGAEIDRLVDADHAAIVDALARRLESAGWQVLIEVTYAIGGERGSIDVLGLRPNARAALVCEVKSDIGASEAAGRKLDEKRRLAPMIVRGRAGWTPDAVGAGTRVARVPSPSAAAPGSCGGARSCVSGCVACHGSVVAQPFGTDRRDLVPLE